MADFITSIGFMKKLLSTKQVVFFTVAMCLATCRTTSAQSVVFAKEPQWKFWLAFENANGQRDTVFIVFDSTATEQPDSLLGEYKVTPDTTKFQVFFANGIGSDSTKVFAVPPKQLGYNNYIFAINDSNSMKIFWDTSLLKLGLNGYEMGSFYFKSIYLDQIGIDYFFLNTVDSIKLFPFMIQGQYASHFPILGDFPLFKKPNSINHFRSSAISVYPNPSNNAIYVRSISGFNKVELVSVADGKPVYEFSNLELTYTDLLIDLSSIKRGVYIIKIYNKKNDRYYYEKFIKN